VRLRILDVGVLADEVAILTHFGSKVLLRALLLAGRGYCFREATAMEGPAFLNVRVALSASKIRESRILAFVREREASLRATRSWARLKFCA
jgi:hypothetical protein